MAGPFKMKGSPMQRNFGIGSPLREESAWQKAKRKQGELARAKKGGEIKHDFGVSKNKSIHYSDKDTPAGDGDRYNRKTKTVKKHLLGRTQTDVYTYDGDKVTGRTTTVSKGNTVKKKGNNETITKKNTKSGRLKK